MKSNSSTHSYVRRFAITFATMLAAYTLASPARAEIVYHSADIGIGGGTYNLDLNGDGITDFAITSEYGFCAVASCFEHSLTETPAQGNGAIDGSLARGSGIGPNQVFDTSEQAMSWEILHLHCGPHCGWSYWSSGGSWLGQAKYLGLSFQVSGQTYYGWAQLSCPNPGGSGTLLGYAYETIPGRAIKAGETSYAWLSSTSLNFGIVTVGTTVSKSVTLTNLGPNTLTIANAALTGSNAADFASLNGNPPCGGSLATGAKCTLTFTFRPSIAGKERGTYSLYDNTGGSPQQLPLDGTGQ